MRSETKTISPEEAAELLTRNESNRPLSKTVVSGFASAMRRGEWKLTHQGIALGEDGQVVDGQHRLSAIVESGVPTETLVFTEVGNDTFDVLDAGRKRNASDALAIAGEKSTHLLASMLRIVWLYNNRPDSSWSGGSAAVTTPQILETLEKHPKVRDFVTPGLEIANATGTIKSAAAGASYLVSRNNAKKKTAPWFDGLIEGAGLTKGDARLKYRNHMLNLARKQASEVQRRRDNREHVWIYLTAFNAWADGTTLPSIRYTQGKAMPSIAKL